MSTVILYIRVSTDEQAIRGYSMKNQKDRLIQYCETNTSKYSFELIQQPLYNEEATKENILIAFTNAIGML